ncbi:hypothetical protein FGB62_19g261 [Gracilaria domingensis]|nr:hypothetical protein FGB62_19g261 [Gracilaria domingensis]
MERSPHRKYDAIIIPGGGLEAQTALPQPWVRARLDAALELHHQTKYFIVLSRGTTHKPPPRDTQGYSIDEAAASAKYLLDNGVRDAERILMDRWSFDTIGNVYFARTMLCEPMKLKRICVITSVFHMPRTRAIFEWIFSLDGHHSEIDYVVTEDRGMSAEQSAARIEKEQQSLKKLSRSTIPTVQTMEDLAQFVFVAHGAYNSQTMQQLVPASVPSRDDEGNGSELLSTY